MMATIHKRPPNTVPVFVRGIDQEMGEFIGYFELDRVDELRRRLKAGNFYTDDCGGLTHNEVNFIEPQFVAASKEDPPFFYELIYEPLDG